MFQVSDQKRGADSAVTDSKVKAVSCDAGNDGSVLPGEAMLENRRFAAR